ncbi:EboA domain-containing protein, partial [Streptomyces galbus]|uniref:EboA domain-containing protein n=1 Tax=Streptomyces galbus TaxID=33898 RepID=UPI001B31A1DE
GKPSQPGMIGGGTRGAPGKRSGAGAPPPGPGHPPPRPAARHLDAHPWRHAVLKCLFTGVPVDAVARLADRARGDGELARMLTDHAAERTAAGRAVPEDLRHVLALTGAVPAPSSAPSPAADHSSTDHPHGKES